MNVPLRLSPSELECMNRLGFSDCPSWEELFSLVEAIDQIDDPDRDVQELYKKLRWHGRLGPRAYGFGSEPKAADDPFVTSRFRAGRERGSVRNEDKALRIHQYLLVFVAATPWEMPSKAAVKKVTGCTMPPWPLPVWAYLAPPCPPSMVPGPGDFAAADAALAWSGTIVVLDDLARWTDGPARWAKNWGIDFYTKCLHEPLGEDLDQEDWRSAREMTVIKWDHTVNQLRRTS